MHPTYQQQGIGSKRLAWAEEEALSMSASAPAGIKTVLQSKLYTGEHDAIQLFRKRGYAKVREWMHLAIELEEAPLVPSLPDGLQMREMDVEWDWPLVFLAMAEAYADHWGTVPELELEAVVDEADESTTGPASFVVIDPDGNQILIDQHR